MKLRLLLLLGTVLCILSCSDDDNGGSTIQEMDLQSITFFENDGDSNSDQKILFENNRPVNWFFYDAAGAVEGHQELTYNESGLLVLSENFNAAGELVTNRSVSYDASGRIIQTISQSFNVPGFPLQRDYVYNSDNTITCTLSSTGMEPDSKFFIYYLNGEGQVYKIIEDYDYETELNYDFVEEVTYSGGNIVTYTSNGYFDGIGEYEFLGSYTNTYDTDIPVEGDYLSFYKNMFNGNEVNVYLYNQFDLMFKVSNNYLISSEDATGNIETRNYTFDDNNYPVHQKTYINNVLETDIYIEYQ